MMRQQHVLPARFLTGILFFFGLLGWSCDEADDVKTIEPQNTVMQVLLQQEDLSTFTDALEYTGLNITLSSQNINFTLFAPNNQAFAAYLQNNGYANLQAVPTETLNSLLRYHITFGRKPAAQLDSADLIDTYGGQKIFVYTTDAGSEIRLNNQANLIEQDLAASNGLIHRLDAVLDPPAASIAGYINQRASAETAEFTLLQTALQHAGLYDFLNSNQQGLTLFAPTDAAFAAAGFATAEDIAAADPGVIRSILLYHLTTGYRYSFMLKNGQLATQHGNKLTVNADEKTLKGAGNAEPVSLLVNTQDVLTTNGIVHAIDGLLLPE